MINVHFSLQIFKEMCWNIDLRIAEHDVNTFSEGIRETYWILLQFQCNSLAGCYTPMHGVQGVYRNHSVRLSVQIRVRPINFWGFTLPYLIWHMGLSPWDDLSRIFMIQIWPWTLTLRSNLLGFWHVFMFAHNFFFIVIGIPYLEHGSITMRWCVKFIHDSHTTLNFDLKDIFIGVMTWLCVQASAICPLTKSYFVWHVSVSPWSDVSRTFMNSVWPWPVTSITTLYFRHEFESGKMSLLFDIDIHNLDIKGV